jgi:hypothetical protein
MTAAGFVGLLAAVPAGRACDRGRPQVVLAIALAALAAAALGFVVVRTVPEALGVACLYGSACQSAYTARAALAALVDPDDPARANARLYRIGNIGYALATPVTGLAATWGTAWAYRLALLGAGGAFALAALFAVLVRARHPAADVVHSDPGSGRGQPWRDRRYVTLTGLWAVTAVQFCIAEFALPLWVVGHTRAPRAMVGASALISTLVVTTLQPTASRPRPRCWWRSPRWRWLRQSSARPSDRSRSAIASPRPRRPAPTRGFSASGKGWRWPPDLPCLPAPCCGLVPDGPAPRCCSLWPVCSYLRWCARAHAHTAQSSLSPSNREVIDEHAHHDPA